jgi:hypothetical protein
VYITGGLLNEQMGVGIGGQLCGGMDSQLCVALHQCVLL